MRGTQTETGTPAGLNVGLLKAIRDEIDRHPDAYDQGTGYHANGWDTEPLTGNVRLWHPADEDQEEPGSHACTSPCCIAGWAWYLTRKDDPPRIRTTSWADQERAAAGYLGLKPAEAANFFAESWPLEWFLAAGIDVHAYTISTVNESGCDVLRVKPEACDAIAVIDWMLTNGRVPPAAGEREAEYRRGVLRGGAAETRTYGEWCVMLRDPETQHWEIVDAWTAEDAAKLHAEAFGNDRAGQARGTVRRGRSYAENECRRMNAKADREAERSRSQEARNSGAESGA